MDSRSPPPTEDIGFFRGSIEAKLLKAINNSQTKTVVEMPLESKRYTLSAEPLQKGDVELTGATLKVDASGDLPVIEGAATAAGSVSFAPGTITFWRSSGPETPRAAVHKQVMGAAVVRRFPGMTSGKRCSATRGSPSCSSRGPCGQARAVAEDVVTERFLENDE